VALFSEDLLKILGYLSMVLLLEKKVVSGRPEWTDIAMKSRPWCNDGPYFFQLSPSNVGSEDDLIYEEYRCNVAMQINEASRWFRLLSILYSGDDFFNLVQSLRSLLLRLLHDRAIIG